MKTLISDYSLGTRSTEKKMPLSHLQRKVLDAMMVLLRSLTRLGCKIPVDFQAAGLEYSNEGTLKGKLRQPLGTREIPSS